MESRGKFLKERVFAPACPWCCGAPVVLWVSADLRGLLELISKCTTASSVLDVFLKLVMIKLPLTEPTESPEVWQTEPNGTDWMEKRICDK